MGVFSEGIKEKSLEGGRKNPVGKKKCGEASIPAYHQTGKENKSSQKNILWLNHLMWVNKQCIYNKLDEGRGEKRGELYWVG